jgi:hypothetical protein
MGHPGMVRAAFASIWVVLSSSAPAWAGDARPSVEARALAAPPTIVSAKNASPAPRESPTGRIAAASALGLIASTVSFGVGAYATAALGAGWGDIDCREPECDRGEAAIIGGSAASAVGATLASYYTSRWMGGDGSFVWTAFGATSGAVMSASLAIVEVRGDVPSTLLWVTLVVPPVIGAVLGHELSAAGESESSGGLMALGVTPIPGGAWLGGAGRF